MEESVQKTMRSEYSKNTRVPVSQEGSIQSRRVIQKLHEWWGMKSVVITLHDGQATSTTKKNAWSVAWYIWQSNLRLPLPRVSRSRSLSLSLMLLHIRTSLTTEFIHSNIGCLPFFPIWKGQVSPCSPHLGLFHVSWVWWVYSYGVTSVFITVGLRSSWWLIH
jgi:hypothetical protein